MITADPNQPTFYANMCGVQFGPEEVVLQFALRDITNPNDGFGVCRVYSSLSHMKRLTFLLSNAVQDYEQMFGEIQSDVMEKVTPEGKLQIEENKRLQESQEKNEQ